MNVIAEIQRLNDREFELNVPLSGSWHQKYSESAWIFIGGLQFELSEGDVLCVVSQFGEIEDIHLVRDGKTGKSKGFAFIKFEDQRSTILAVDNLNGSKLLDRVLRVDHVLKYKLPKELQDSDSEEDETARKPRGLPGHAYEGKELASSFNLHTGVDVFATPKETHKEKKKRKKEEKRIKKAAKKIKKIQKKQQKTIELVQKQRQEKQEASETVQVKIAEREAIQPSATGWRGRFEPSVLCHRREKDLPPQNETRDQREEKSFGGRNRTR